MSEPSRDPQEAEEESPTPLRADALASRERILDAAALRRGDRTVSMAGLAAAAGVGRSTLYRHFATRKAIDAALAERERGSVDAGPSRVAPLAFRAPGLLGRADPLIMEVTRVLDEVPPHLVPEQLIAEARPVSGRAVALYVVDIDGSSLVRLAGSQEFPERIPDPPALGPELVPEGLAGFFERVARQLPGCRCEPLWLRGRVLGVLLILGQPLHPLADVARQGAAALELAGDYTDFIEIARRRKATTPAAEIQQNLFPPRIARFAGAQLAGALSPSDEVGGDWFDFVENRDGVWLAIADAFGTGPTAAGLGAASLGSLRAARRAGGDLLEAAAAMRATVAGLGSSDFYVTALLARWRAATSSLSWINCGNPPPYLVARDGTVQPLEAPLYPPLGQADPAETLETTSRQLHSGERLVLVTDGIIERQTEDGSTFGADGVAAAVAAAEHPTAACTAMAIQAAVASSWSEPLADDATVVVLAID